MKPSPEVLKLIKAARKVDLPAAIGDIGDKAGWCRVDDWEKFCKQCTALSKALKPFEEKANNTKHKATKK